MEKVCSTIVKNYRANEDISINCSTSGYYYQNMSYELWVKSTINPIVVSRFLKIFSHWNSYVDPYRKQMLIALKYIDGNELSNNTREVINMILKK